MRDIDDLRDDYMQARAEHYRSRRAYYYDETRERDEAVRAECESEEAEEARWQRIFERQAAEMPAVHYADRPGIDRRVFAVDGDDDQPDVDQPNDVPWPAA